MGADQDHSVPLKCIKEILISGKAQKIDHIEATLLKHYRLGLITSAEDQMLTKEGLRQRMPEDCTNDPFARYRRVGIDCAHSLPNPDGIVLPSLLKPLPIE